MGKKEKVQLVVKTMPYDKKEGYLYYECSGCGTVNDYGARTCQGCKLPISGIVRPGRDDGLGDVPEAKQ